MVFEKKDYLITGRKNPKTKEKIRLKLRYLLNNYSKCLIGISNQADGRLRFRLEKEGYRALFYVYRSATFESVEHYTKVFQDLYVNETNKEYEELANAISEDGKGPFFLFVAARKPKRGY